MISIDVKGVIGVATSEHISLAIGKAEAQGAQLVIIKLDTPGGLVSSTRDIIKAILASRVPIAVYVSPSGGHAASAGTYITYAAHIAAMAPGTNIGAATPIQISLPAGPGRQDPKRESTDKPAADKPGTEKPAAVADQKAVNDAVALLRSLAQMRGRNIDWAEKAVREAATLTPEEALKERVVDIVARDIRDLLAQIDGRTVSTVVGDKRLSTSDANVTTFAPTLRIQLLSVLADPNIAFILLLIGIYGILFEMYAPGFVGPGVIGGISLLLALTALTLLPVNYAGLGLLLFGIALMTAEALIPGLGVLGIGGAVAFIAGALFLFDPAGADFNMQVAWPLIVAAALSGLLLSAFVFAMATQARQRKVATGAEEMIGSVGQVIEWANGEGRVRVHGEIWSAHAKRSLEPGQAVRVLRREGLTLFVEPVK
ncbi:MAG: NfeD family protein [Hyphomicrobiaceae bacterium]